MPDRPAQPPPVDADALGVATMLVNVAVVPSQEVATAVAQLARGLPENSPLRVDNGAFRPHLTLYMARFDRRVIDRLVDLTEDLTSRTQRFRCQEDGYNYTPGRYYEVTYRRSRRLMRLHKSLVADLSGLRFRPKHPVRESYFGPYSADQRRHARRTGYDLSGRLYRPHITVGRLAVAARVALPIAESDLSFLVATVGLFEADENGAARRQLREFTLGT